MGTPDDIPVQHEWLRHAAALRALAGVLCADEHEAEDLVQETWVRAARHPRDAGARAWLASVLRNLVRDRARERGRRGFVEREVARAEALPSDAEIVERLDVARKLAEELARLPEPYRTAIHLRWFEGLAPEEIARRGGLPIETVRTRLRRGLEKLRERMDEASDGGRGAWMLALAPISLRSAESSAAISAGSGAVGPVGSLAAIGGVVMGSKLVLSLAAAAAVVVVAFLAWPESGKEGVVAAGGVVVAETPALDGGNAAPLAAPAAPPISREEVAAASPHAPAASPAPADGRFEVRGTVVIVDESGADLRGESGTLLAICGTSESDYEQREVAFEKGAWTIRIPTGGFLVFGRLVARGREALLPGRRPNRPGAEPIEVRGRWLKRGRLRVVDATTKQDLRGVEVRCAKGWRANPEWLHPGDAKEIETVIADADSPFDLPERLILTPYWVHAPGHAWARIDFDHGAGGERTIELIPPAAVEVTTVGALPEDAFVRLERGPKAEAYWFASASVRAAKNGPTRIVDMTPGKYFASIELGEFDGVRSLGSAPVELVAGEVASVTVTVDASVPVVPTTHLFGTLFLPDGVDVRAKSSSMGLWREGGGAESKRILLADMHPVNGDERVRAWDAGMVPTGTWGAHVWPPNFSQLVHADSPGDTQVEIRVPDLLTLEIEVVDAKTGAAVEPEHIYWSGPRVEGLSQSTSAPITSVGAKGHYRLVAPAGTAHVMCKTSGYADHELDVEMRPGAAPLKIALHVATGVRLELFEGDALVIPRGEFWFKVAVYREGSHRPTGRPASSTMSEKTIHLDEAGRYEIQFFETPEGFEKIEKQVVDVPAGQVIDVRVPVRRKP